MTQFPANETLTGGEHLSGKYVKIFLTSKHWEQLRRRNTLMGVCTCSVQLTKQEMILMQWKRPLTPFLRWSFGVVTWIEKFAEISEAVTTLRRPSEAKSVRLCQNDGCSGSLEKKYQFVQTASWPAVREEWLEKLNNSTKRRKKYVSERRVDLIEFMSGSSRVTIATKCLSAF